MRAILAATSMIVLAACGEGGVVDDTVRAGLRQSALETCLAWAPESTVAEAAGLSRERLCGCAADRLMESGSLSELADLNPASPEARAAVLQCVREIGPAAGADAAG